MPAVATSAVPAAAWAEDVVPATNSGKAVPEAVYFGNGCFWGRQFDFVQTGRRACGRAEQQAYSGVHSNTVFELLLMEIRWYIVLVIVARCRCEGGHLGRSTPPLALACILPVR
jgi:hypothetical protein